MLQFLTYLLHKQIIEMCRSQNLRCPFLVPSRRLWAPHFNGEKKRWGRMTKVSYKTTIKVHLWAVSAQGPCFHKLSFKCYNPPFLDHLSKFEWQFHEIRTNTVFIKSLSIDKTLNERLRLEIQKNVAVKRSSSYKWMLTLAQLDSFSLNMLF